MRIQLLLSFVACLSSSAFANVKYDEAYLSANQRDGMADILKSAVNQQKLPSLVAAATYGDKVIWAGAIGHADVQNKVLADPEKHLYRWASVSKVATERFAQALQEQGLLDRNQPISTYVPLTEPSFLRRCFSSDGELQKFITCTKNYGGFGPVTMMTGFPRCFNPTTLDAVSLTKGNSIFSAQIVDKTTTQGQVVYRDSKGKAKCVADYKTGHAYVSSQKVTLNNLLSHRSGIMHYEYLGLRAEPPASQIGNIQAVKQRKDAGKSQMEWAVSAFYPTHPLLFLPNSGQHYSSFAYNLAGVVLEKASGKIFEKIMSAHSWKIGALSMQADYLGLAPAGPYPRSFVYKRSNDKFVLNNYDTDNSYKLAGGGIMSTAVDLARFCVGISNDNMVTKKGRPSYSHSGSHPSRSKAYLALATGGRGKPQCLVLMTNTEHASVDLPAIKKLLETKLISYKAWEPPRAK